MGGGWGGGVGVVWDVWFLLCVKLGVEVLKVWKVRENFFFVGRQVREEANRFLVG